MIKTTAIYFVGNFASKLLSFVLLPLYTAYLTSEDFGTVDLLMSTLPLIAPIFTMQVTESVFRFLMTDSTIEDRKKTITTSLTVFITGIIIFFVLYIPFVIRFDFNYAVLFFIYFFITYIGIFLQQVLRGLQRTIEYAITGVISTIIHATVNILLIVKFGLGGESLLIASISASFVITIFIATRIRIWEFIDFTKVSRLELSKQLRFGIPLIPNQIAWWIIGLLGKYILMYYHGTADNGILAVANKFPNLLMVINSIFLKAWTENIIQEFTSKDRDQYFSTGFETFTVFTFSLTAWLLPIIKIYNVLTITGEFVDAWKYIPVLIIGSSFNSLATFLGTAYTASMKTKEAFTTTIIAAASNLLFSFLMISTLSIWGVVLANMLSFVVFYFVRIKSVESIINLKVNFLKLIPSLVLLIISIFAYYALNIYYQIMVIFILGVITLYLNRKIVINLLDFLTKIKAKKHS